MNGAGLRAELDKLAGQRERVVGEREIWCGRLEEALKVEPFRWELTEANRVEARRRIAAYDEQLQRLDEKSRVMKERLPTPSDVSAAQVRVDAIGRGAAEVAERFGVQWRQLLHRLRQAEAEARALAPLRHEEEDARSEAARLADQYGVGVDLPDLGPEAGERREALLLVALLQGVVGHGRLRPETLRELKQMRAA